MFVSKLGGEILTKKNKLGGEIAGLATHEAGVYSPVPLCFVLALTLILLYTSC